jgi:uncharacterized protein DUF6188
VNLGIAGQSIERVCIDHAVTLLTNDGAEIRIETVFSLRTPGGELLLVDPERPGQTGEAVPWMLHEVIAGATADDIGTLILDLINGTRLEVAPNDSYEAWGLTRRDGFKLVARPGGGLSTWAPDL